MKIITRKRVSLARLFMVALPIMNLMKTSNASSRSASIPPEGQCQHYHLGGTSYIHIYTCCNHSGKVCTTEEFDGADDGKYCDGGPSIGGGGGYPIGNAFTCGDSCEDAKQCKDFCDREALSRQGFCWNWSLCFDACCESPSVFEEGGNDDSIFIRNTPEDTLPTPIMATPSQTKPTPAPVPTTPTKATPAPVSTTTPTKPLAGPAPPPAGSGGGKYQVYCCLHKLLIIQFAQNS